MKTLIDVAVPATTFILLTAVGMDLTTADFARVGRQRALVLAGLFAPLVLLPPIAVGLIQLFQTTPDVSAGVLLVAACPIGGISNAYSYLARASTALSVTLTGLSCLCAAATIPLVAKGLDAFVPQSFELEAPITVLVRQVLLVLGLPVVLGMWVRRRSPARAERHRPALQRLSFIGIGVVLLLVIVDDLDAFMASWSTTVPIAAVFVMASMAAGWMTAALVTRDRRDRFTIAAEFGARNVGVAIAVAVTVLGRVEFARFAATYALTEVPIMLAAVVWFRRSQERAGVLPQDLAAGRK